MDETLFDDDAYDLPQSGDQARLKIVRELVEPVGRTEYAINYRDGADLNARQVVSGVGSFEDIEKQFANQIKEGVIRFFNNDNELILLPVSRLLSIDIFPPKEWR